MHAFFICCLLFGVVSSCVVCLSLQEIELFNAVIRWGEHQIKQSEVMCVCVCCSCCFLLIVVLLLLLIVGCQGYASMSREAKTAALKATVADVRVFRCVIVMRYHVLLIAQLLPFIRFGSMTVSEFSPVPRANVLPEDHVRTCCM